MKMCFSSVILIHIVKENHFPKKKMYSLFFTAQFVWDSKKSIEHKTSSTLPHDHVSVHGQETDIATDVAASSVLF